MNGPNAEAITIKDVAIALTSPRYFVPKYSGQKVPLKELLMPCIIPNKLNGIIKKIFVRDATPVEFGEPLVLIE